MRTFQKKEWKTKKSRQEISAQPRTKSIYVGAPACFALDLVAWQVAQAFSRDGFGIYLVGSCLSRPDWRDVDVRLIMSDKEFDLLFPGTIEDGHWESDPRWLLMTTAISQYMSNQTGLPIDFQFQAQTHANKQHKGMRSAIGLRHTWHGDWKDATRELPDKYTDYVQCVVRTVDGDKVEECRLRHMNTYINDAGLVHGDVTIPYWSPKSNSDVKYDMCMVSHWTYTPHLPSIPARKIK